MTFCGMNQFTKCVLEGLGGISRLRSFVNASHFTEDTNKFSFRFALSNGVNHVQYVYTASDYITINYGMLQSEPLTYTVVSSSEELGIEQIFEDFEQTTGLFLSFNGSKPEYE
jgi:hypothetical protein